MHNTFQYLKYGHGFSHQEVQYCYYTNWNPIFNRQIRQMCQYHPFQSHNGSGYHSKLIPQHLNSLKDKFVMEMKQLQVTGVTYCLPLSHESNCPAIFPQPEITFLEKHTFRWPVFSRDVAISLHCYIFIFPHFLYLYSVSL